MNEKKERRCRVKTVSLETFCHISCDVRNPEIFPESWAKRDRFSLYESSPRPCSALFLICTDVHVSFFSSDGAIFSAGKGDVVWIPEGICYHARVDGGSTNRIDTYTINFQLYGEDGEGISLSESILVLPRRGDGLLEHQAKMLTEAVHRVDGRFSDGQKNQFKIKAAFYAFADALFSSAQERTDAYYPIRVGAEALRNEWNKNERIEKYADLCGVSRAYFYRCFHEWSGKSPVEYRNMIRLSNAQTMLRNTDMRVSEISATVGFDDPFYFCRIFKKNFGLSPQGYRKKTSEA